MPQNKKTEAVQKKKAKVQPSKKQVKQPKVVVSPADKKQQEQKKQVSRALRKFEINAQPTLEVAPQYSKTEDATDVKCEWLNGGATVLEVMYALNGYLLSRNISSSVDFSWNDYYNGMTYLFRGLMSEVTGNVVLDKRPAIINDLIAALSPKSSKFGTGSWSFAWDFTNSAPFSQTVLQYPWGTMDLVQAVTDGGVDDGTYKSASPAYQWGTTLEEPLLAYNKLLLQIQGIDDNKRKWVKSVTKDQSSKLAKDVSAFARTYAYGENAFSTGGAYNDVECEAIIHNPDMSHFSPYGNLNVRVPSKNCIAVSSGTASMALSPLLTVENGWFNKIPAIFHYVDFYEIVNRLCYWYAELNHVYLAIDGQSVKYQTLPFTFQDFCIMVRQAVLSLFPDQWAVSAVSPGIYSTKTMNFIPFAINGHCFPSNEFSSMLAPQLIVENLAALQSMVHIPKGGSGSANKTRYIPVLGIWDTDAPNFFTFDNGTPMFRSDPQDQITLSQLKDLQKTPTYINANSSYYVGVKDTWNSFVSDLKGVSTNIMAVSGVTPCNMPLAVVHRVIEQTPGEGRAPFDSDWACTRNIANLTRKKAQFTEMRNKKFPLVRQGSKEVLAPLVFATQDALIIRSQLSKDPLRSDIQNLMQYLILPSIRLGAQNSSYKVITELAAKTMLECPHSLPLAPANSLFPSWLAVQKDMGQLCVTGFAREATSTYNDVMNFLEGRGHAGLLGSILGGAVKAIIPGSSGVVDTLQSIFPF